jgi:hypothetical protein
MKFEHDRDRYFFNQDSDSDFHIPKHIRNDCSINENEIILKKIKLNFFSNYYLRP